MKHKFKQADFSLRVDLYANMIFAIFWYLAPVLLLSYNFNIKNNKYDCIHKHFARVLGVGLLLNALVSNYALNKKCPYTKSKILIIKVLCGLVLLATMAFDNFKCTDGVMGSKHILFGMLGLTILIIINYIGLKSLKSKINNKKN